MTGEHPEHRAKAQVRFDGRVYALSTVKKAAYRFLKTFTADITQDADWWVCTLAFPTPVDRMSLDKAIRDLQTEVLDQDLRATVARETEAVRNTILGLAFSRTGLQDGE